MQYILTQEEYDALTPVKRLQERNDALEVARKIIVKAFAMNCGSEYCDDCPISDIGDSRGDENRPTHRQSKLICIDDRKYSK